MLFLFEEKPLEIENKQLIKRLSFHIEDHEHLAIIGVNGVGKSTLLHHIHKNELIDTAMMEQDLSKYDDIDVMDYVMSAYPKLVELRKDLSDIDSLNSYIELDGYNVENNIIIEGNKLGLSSTHFEQKIGTLSGGEQTKVSFLKVILSDAPLLLIDEPTNHMDKEMKVWLIKAFKSEQRAILLVSHDREFLNETPDAILELTKDGATRYSGHYDDYKNQKDIEIETEKLKYEKEQKEQKAIEESIKKYKEWYQSAAQKASVRSPYAQKQLSKLAKRFKSKEHQLNRKLEESKSDNPLEENKSFSIENNEFKSHYLVRFENVSFSYKSREIFKDTYFEIKRNQTVIIEGKNGSGKSTLIQLILGNLLPMSGAVKKHPDLDIGYFSQDFQNLNPNNSVLEEVMDIENMTITDARTILASFYFDKSRMNDKVRQLSMGEKCRLQFVKLYFSNPHILILDEPTNYFDIGMQEKIIQLIQSFNGAVIIVSHDEIFKDEIRDQVWKIENCKLIHENVSINTPIDAESMKDELKILEQYTVERNKETDF